MKSMDCPCGSGRRLADCCGAYLQHKTRVADAESLMRSRYTAYVLGDADWLLQTWHPSRRPAELQLDDPATAAMQWLELRILGKTAGGQNDEQGTVEFLARYRNDGRVASLHETSRFVREQGRWYYVDGQIHKAEEKTGRNAPCPCGSGRKYKRCCGS